MLGNAHRYVVQHAGAKQLWAMPYFDFNHEVLQIRHLSSGWFQWQQQRNRPRGILHSAGKNKDQNIVDVQRPQERHAVGIPVIEWLVSLLWKSCRGLSPKCCWSARCSKKNHHDTPRLRYRRSNLSPQDWFSQTSRWHVLGSFLPLWFLLRDPIIPSSVFLCFSLLLLIQKKCCLSSDPTHTPSIVTLVITPWVRVKIGDFNNWKL